MSTQALESAAPQLRPSRPLSVLCGTQPALGSLAAAHQAVEIAGSGRVAFVSVATPADPPADEMYLDAAVFLAHRDRGARGVRRLDGGRAVSQVLALAARYDLMVVGAPVSGELSPVVLAAVCRARIPVLVARRLPRGDALGARVVLVLGDEGGDARAAGLATSLARTAGAEIAATVTDHGGSADAVLHAARRAGATVIAIGDPTTPRGRNAADLAVTVAQDASCSVLVARGREGRARSAARAANSTAAPAPV